jgi:hypothetical protein
VAFDLLEVDANLREHSGFDHLLSGGFIDVERAVLVQQVFSAFEGHPVHLAIK